MNKKLIAVAIAASLTAPVAMAESSVTVYGKVRQSVDFVDLGGSDNVQINNQASRLGFKGSEDLGNGLKAVFKMEFQVAISENDSNGNEFGVPGKGDVFSGRNAYVGLAGSFGTVLVGRHDHPLKMSTGSLDYFADSQGDYNRAYMGGLVDLRADGVVAYVSPNFSGFTGIAAVVPGENNDADGIADAYSIAGIYKNGGIFLSAAYEEGDEDLDSLDGTGNLPTGDYEQWRIGAGYGMDAWAVNLVYAEAEIEDGSTQNLEADTYVLSGKYTMGNNVIKAKYFDTDNNDVSSDVDGFAIGLDHNFSKRTQASVMYVSSDSSDSSVDGDIFSIQMNHSF